MKFRFELTTPSRQRGMVALVPGIALLIWVALGISAIVIGLSVAIPLRLLKNNKVRMVAVLMVLAGLWGLTFYPEISRKTKAEAREKAIRVCRGDLPSIPDELLVDSLAIEPGMIDRALLASLIGERRLRFVELKAYPSTRGKEQETWNVHSFNGSSHDDFQTQESKPYVRVSLASMGDSTCANGAPLGINLVKPERPFSPDACLSVTTVEESEASHVLKAEPDSNEPDYIRWTVLERESGRVMASLVSNDSPTRPVLQGGSLDPSEVKQTSGGWISCRMPFFSLMRLFRSPRVEYPWMALLERTVTEKEAVIDTKVGSNWHANLDWPEVAVEERLVEDWDGPAYKHLRTYSWSSQDWEKAYRLAAETGWASIGSSVIDFAAGEIVSLGKNGAYRLHTRASKDGFMVVYSWPYWRSGVPVVLYSLDGNVLWRVLIKPNKASPVYEGSTEFVAMEWHTDKLQIYGRRRGSGSMPHVYSSMTLQFPMQPAQNAAPDTRQ